MSHREIYITRQLYIRARKQRNATTSNLEFDYWQDIMEHQLELLTSLLKTGEK